VKQNDRVLQKTKDCVSVLWFTTRHEPGVERDGFPWFEMDSITQSILGNAGEQDSGIGYEFSAFLP